MQASQSALYPSMYDNDLCLKNDAETADSTISSDLLGSQTTLGEVTAEKDYNTFKVLQAP